MRINGDIHLRYTVKNAKNSVYPINLVFMDCHWVMSAPRMGNSIELVGGAPLRNHSRGQKQ